MATFNMVLDLDKSVLATPQNPVNVRVGDMESCTIVAEIVSGGAAANLAGCTARFEAVRADGTMFVDSDAAVSGSTVTYTVGRDAATVPGRMKSAYFAIIKGSEVIDTTQDFAINVLPSAESGSTGLGEPYHSDVERAVASAGAATSRANAAAALADDSSAKVNASISSAAAAADKASAAAADALLAAEEARGSIDPDKRIYLTYDAVGDVEYITLADTED